MPRKINISLPYNFTPRAYQYPALKALDRGIKRAVLVWHRRSGKDKTMLNYMIAASTDRVGGYYYFFPTYSQAKKVIWAGIDRDGFRYLEHFPPAVIDKKYDTELKIITKYGSIFQLVGTDNIDSIMGTNPVGCVFSEYSLQNPVAWDYIRPILRENGGWAVFIYTPRGKNHGWDLYDTNQDNPDWYTEVLTVNDTKRPDGSPVITLEDIEKERREGMSEELIEQEYFCSFEAAMPGAYYAHEIRRARDEGRIRSVPFDPAVHVSTFWDLGMDGSMSIWFAQEISQNEIRLIDYYENSGEGLAAYFQVLRDKARDGGWVYGRHVAPHDINVRELTSTVDPGEAPKSRWEIAKSLGITFEVTKRPEHKEDGIEAVRSIFHKFWFDKDKCKQGLNCLSSFRREYNRENKIYGLSPVKDWSMHGADALQTLALSSGLEGKFGDLSGVYG